MRRWVLVLTVCAMCAFVATAMLSGVVQAGAPKVSGAFDCSTVTEIPQIECEALVALYNSTDGPNWNNNANWLQTTEPCSWTGVDCTDGSVTSLRLEMNGLRGSLPPELGNLANLQILYLFSNELTGSIPPELGALIKVESLYLSNNQLSGSIPPELGNLTNLQNLFLGDNLLSGSIPPELGSLTNLYILDLKSNQLTGTIPPELGSLTNLESLSLFDNQLSGSIPPELGNLTSLVDLLLHHNHLSGSIPRELGSLTNLANLYLNNNQLSGSIPPELGNITNLASLDLSFNQLSGPLPSQLSNLFRIKGLSLAYNMLWADDEMVQAWADAREPNWESTQTTPPADVQAVPLDTSTIQVGWTPISYTQDAGFYEVSYAVTSGGPYTIAGHTESKSDSTFNVINLDPGTTYYFVVRSFTAAHDEQQNELLSPPSAEASATTSEAPTAIQLTTWAVSAAPISSTGRWMAWLGIGMGLSWYLRRRHRLP